MINLDFVELNKLIGERIRYGDRIYTIIDILDEGPALILQSTAEYTVIQENQHGNPSRRGRHTATIPLLSADGRELNPHLQQLASIIHLPTNSEH